VDFLADRIAFPHHPQLGEEGQSGGQLLFGGNGIVL
jgi:hypothetical protein